MMVLKKKEILIGILILLIGVAGYINWNYSGDQESGEDTLTAMAPQEGAAGDSVEDEVDFAGEHSAPEQEGEPQSRNMGEAQYVSVNTGSGNYFAEARLNRANARSKSVEMLNGIVNNSNSDAESKRQAGEAIMRLAELENAEALAENLIKAKGFEDVIVFVNDDIANVTVKSESLSGSDTAKIQEVVTSQTGVLIKNIKIVEVR